MHQQNQTMLSRGDLIQRPSQPLPRTVRASNDDRQRIIEQLQAHYVAGRLSSSELESRVEQTLAAVTFGDLEVILADLPNLDAAHQPAAEQARSREGHHQGRHHKPHGERPFRSHVTSYLLVMTMLVIIWALTSPGGYFWPVWPMLGWGIGLAAHGLAARSRPASVIGYQ